MGHANFDQVFFVLLRCISPCIWGAALVVLYRYRRLTSFSWMVFLGSGILFLTSSVSTCVTIAQVFGEFDPGDNVELISQVYQGISIVWQLATILFVTGVWLSFREMHDRLDMLTDIVETGDHSAGGGFGQGF